MNNDKTKWGPNYWHTLHSICLAYPKYPNSVVKKKYYDLISNIPIFIPDHSFGDNFAELLDKYPLKPYLDSQAALCKWMHFIHNKVNEQLNKPRFSFHDYIVKYTTVQKPIDEKKQSPINGIILILLLLIFVIILFKK